MNINQLREGNKILDKINKIETIVAQKNNIESFYGIYWDTAREMPVTFLVPPELKDELVEFLSNKLELYYKQLEDL